MRRKTTYNCLQIVIITVLFLLVSCGGNRFVDSKMASADSLMDVLKKGGNFEELAKTKSADSSAAKGGDLGWIYPGDTVPDFERAMNALQAGEVSPPVRSPFGWHLIQVIERRIQDVTDERKRNAARQALRQRKGEQSYEDWLRQLRDSTYVDYRLERE